MVIGLGWCVLGVGEDGGKGGQGGTIPRAGFPVVVRGFVGGGGCYGERSGVWGGGGGLSPGRWFSGLLMFGAVVGWSEVA